MIDLKALGAKLRALFGANTPGLDAFEFDTAGDGHTPPAAPIPFPTKDIVDGWYTGARRVDIHAGRVGGAIVPWSTVVHTTDMAPGTFKALLKRWTDTAGEGAGAHFLIGKTPEDGLVQMVSIKRNGNHAGGRPNHGWYKLGTRLFHPNNVAVGIELDNAGRLVRGGSGGRGDAWVHKDSGRVFAPKDVYVLHGRGYERVTDYQMQTLGVLLDALDAYMPRPPDGAVVVPNGTYRANGCPEARLAGVREVGHWTLDPTRKTDPGPQVTEFLRSRRR